MANDTPNPRGPDAVTHQLPAGELPAGWTLLGGQYEIKRLIASGGFGITYLAGDTLGRDVAVKECFPLGLAQRAAMTHTVSATSAGTSEHFETARAQFLREARMLARLRHPNVVHVQTLFEENGTAYMAMDFIHGRDLHEEIVGSDAGLAPARVLELARDLLGALDYVHGQGVLHRDIKPQNIRIDRFGMPMLIDFGAARAETQARSRMAGTFRVVTDGYSPHEFYVTGAAQGPHSDLYALAATLHHVITGAAPVAADERASALATGQPDPYVPIAGRYEEHDARLLTLIDRALRMAPDDRPENAAAWLSALADAPTTLVQPAVAAPAEGTARGRSRFVPGLLVGALLIAGAGGAIWATQPPWLTPDMGAMMERMSLLESSLAEAEAAREAATAELEGLQAELNAAEAELARLEEMDGDMAATMAELDAARAARDTAADRIAGLEEDLTTLAETQAALEAAQAERNAAEARAAELVAEGVADDERIGALEAARDAATEQIRALELRLSQTTGALEEARTQAAQLREIEADLTVTEAALASANARAMSLEEQLQQALAGETDAEALQEQLSALEDVLAATEAERDRLRVEADTMSANSDDNATEMETLRTRIEELEAENDTLRAALARAQEALALTGVGEAAETAHWVQDATLRSPNGTLALLPRFSWDNQRIAVADDTGGIALYNRETGGYEAHLARGIPDTIRRLGFSRDGTYLIATTEDGAPNRLYHIPTRREILRFEPTTVTTANRAISEDERYFIFTRTGAGNRTEVVLYDLDALSAAADPGAAPDTVLTEADEGDAVRITFAETSNQILVVTPTQLQLFQPDGRLTRSNSNRIGPFAALSPIGGDQGLMVLRGNGTVRLLDDPVTQSPTAEIPANSSYTRYRLSGNRLNFLRANSNMWEVIDLLTGEIRGSGELGAGRAGAFLSISSDASMLFIGAIGTVPAQVIEVETGQEVQSFGDAREGYFSFDNLHLATGTLGEPDAEIWRLGSAPAPEPVIATLPVPVQPVAPVAPAPDLTGCAVLDRVGNGISILPGGLENGRIFSVQAGGGEEVTRCAAATAPALAQALQSATNALFVTRNPDIAIDIQDTSRPVELNVRATGSCGPVPIVRFGTEWHLPGGTGPAASVALSDDGNQARALDIWLAAPEGETCDALITLTGTTTAP
ncbi:serine/threonine-protein kinase [Hasllibacter sp. MH4015]|uniref:serine/threonine-protein kinase n=1 Tax=Hasllibacter sp. MH4015 TaxID=2854029 RepID=UPI001CD6A48E|nr:serine/threonine-protein kinase [Hasllibacter sp. MH4015]